MPKAPSPLTKWLDCYRSRLQLETVPYSLRRERMNRINPCYVLRAHSLDRVIERAEHGDFTGLDTLMKLIQNPFEERPDTDDYRLPQEVRG